MLRYAMAAVMFVTITALPSTALAQAPEAKAKTSLTAKAKNYWSSRTERKEKRVRAKQERTERINAQQTRMKSCSRDWEQHKKTNNVTGAAAYRKFMGECLKG